LDREIVLMQCGREAALQYFICNGCFEKFLLLKKKKKIKRKEGGGGLDVKNNISHKDLNSDLFPTL
jgi:hypothetical protein